MNSPSDFAGGLPKRLAHVVAISVLLALPAPPALAGGPSDFSARATIGAVEQTNRLIIRYRDGSSSTPSAVSLAASSRVVQDLSVRRGLSASQLRLTGTGAQVWTLNRAVSVAEARDLAHELVALDSRVEYVEPDRLMRAQFTPNDPSYASQWHYYETTAGINLPAAWDRGRGKDTLVAVIDTGYRPHADLAGNVTAGAGYDLISDSFIANDGNERDDDPMDPGDNISAGECLRYGWNNAPVPSSWHGTHVAGTIGALSNNGVGVAGVAYQSRILPIRVLGKCGGYESDVADAIMWASGHPIPGLRDNSSPASVINLSIGGAGGCGSTYASAINLARSRGVVVVVAAGNSNTDVSNSAPANCAGVIAVAAVNRDGSKAAFSNFGSLVSVAAPGVSVVSTSNTGAAGPVTDSYASYQGTSMAAPHVAGVAALIRSMRRSLTPDQVADVIRKTAKPFPVACLGCGSGIVNAAAAIDAVTYLAASPNPADLSYPVEMTVAVTGTEPSGTVSFYDGPTLIATQSIFGAGETVPVVKRFTTVGNHTITAQHTGGPGSPAQNWGPLTVRVDAQTVAQTTTTLTGPDEVWWSNANDYFMTATIIGANPTGTVDFHTVDGLRASVPLSGGVASISLCTLFSCYYSWGGEVVAKYSGDANNARSASAPRSVAIVRD